MVKKHWQRLSGRGKRVLGRLQKQGGWRRFRGFTGASKADIEQSSQVKKSFNKPGGKEPKKSPRTVGTLHRRHK